MPVANTKENMNQCICGNCPSFKSGDEGFFCAVGKSNKITEKKGCICGQCGVFKHYKLGSGYFCFSGKA
ncbi:MAG: DUF2769 domain-containing protein [bacterium]|nr:DUF2769 domain-containing protein [bacterium]